MSLAGRACKPADAGERQARVAARQRLGLPYKSIVLSDQTVAGAGNAAIVRHAWASESESGGKSTLSKIGVLQVWQKQGTSWKLLARQAFKP